MTPDEFFSAFMKELEINYNLRTYYKFLERKKRFLFRKSYFLKRLEFILEHAGHNDNYIWDVGCGYGTSAIFLALNGYHVDGSTLEFYYEQFPDRLKYWEQFGDLSKFVYRYENIFKIRSVPKLYDRIIVQDTLHHLEPIEKALELFSKVLKPNGEIIVVEANGRNIYLRLFFLFKRGNKRVVSFHDDKLNEDYLVGNENIRSISEWIEIFERFNFKVSDLDYIRLFLPFQWTDNKFYLLQRKEKEIWHKNIFLRDYAYVGINFIAKKFFEI